jgi:hypothetical protein
MYCFCWLSGLTWVAWAYIAAYGKRALIRIRDQPPLHQSLLNYICQYYVRDHSLLDVQIFVHDNAGKIDVQCMSKLSYYCDIMWRPFTKSFVSENHIHYWEYLNIVCRASHIMLLNNIMYFVPAEIHRCMDSWKGSALLHCLPSGTFLQDGHVWTCFTLCWPKVCQSMARRDRGIQDGSVSHWIGRGGREGGGREREGWWRGRKSKREGGREGRWECKRE